ncbi:DUF4394 domain-containing protein [Chryseobacterium arthrosphaerae]|uniref:DUF4394 domain-containing protein n=1 Tax=Chryseobacterium arthrosphaerae TaxID=651561 RepID=A0A1B8ZUZ5_9FLAO|nr:DUF4394 domain-containing protein [Chryseobacterium arthrosphaerae]OCA75416.1 hypothetical protein BBI00_14220 [Chryseobacterium arthrosphaerae]
MRKLLHTYFALFAFIALLSCDNSDDNMPDMMNPQGPDLMVYGITAMNELVYFNSNNPKTFTSKTAVTGIPSGEKLLSIDFRPATGELYALSNASKLYIINTSNASARVVGSTAFTPMISGTTAAIDFNPTVDRIRLVSNTGQNLRLHPETGAVAATDININGTGNPSVTGLAYTNSKAGASATILYDIDPASGKLYKQDPPNNGTLVEVGSLGTTFTGQAAFDIKYDNSIALLALNNQLHILDLNNGKTTSIGSLQQGIIDIAIPTEPVAYAIDNSNNLQIFNPNNPMPVSKTVAGLQSGENILGIDFRPVNGQLYALGSSSRIYTINLGTGTATAVGSAPFSTLLSGTDFGFDFNPTVDRIRVVSNTGQNLRLNPNDGTIAATDIILNPGSPIISAAAYTNNFAGAASTTLFVIDHNTDKLYQQNPPNNGTLVETGPLGINITGANGFDIGSMSQKAYLMASIGSSTKIYSINTTTGAATSVSDYPNTVKAFTVGLGF